MSDKHKEIVNNICQDLVYRFGIESCIVESNKLYTSAYDDNYKSELVKLKVESLHNKCLKHVRTFVCCFGAYEVYNGFLKIKYLNKITFNQVTIMGRFSYDKVLYLKTSDNMGMSEGNVRLFDGNESVQVVN
jgi:hypothetical protein